MYRKEHYERNKQKYITRSKIWKKDFVDWWKEYKKQFSCQECGEDHPSCIDFHHLDLSTKYKNVSSLVYDCDKKKLLEEVAKCISLCANCHRKLHYN